MRTLTFLTVLAVGAAARAQAPSCPFGSGALPVATLPAGARHGAQIPINHIVVLMQENRSEDHYFGQLHRQGQARAEGEPRDASNPDPTNPGGPPIRAFHQTRVCEVADLDHSWNGTHGEWDNGLMDGFTAANVNPKDPTGSRTMGFYDKTDLPFYYKLYKRFAIGDRYFCSALTQTFPNRFYLLAGTSFGHIRNDFPNFATGEYSQRTIFNLLDEANPPISWKVYHSGLPFAGLFGHVRLHADRLVPVQQYFDDAQAGTLPQVSYVDPIFVGPPNVENDEHPPANVQVGQEFVSRVVKALMASPLWNSSVLFLTYDEHGGFFDHVPPPPACVPDNIPPMLQSGDVPGAFDRYGIRAPVVVVSAFARRHFVSHRVHDHTSILRFIETRFDLPALTVRDANADPMLEFFHFNRPRRPGRPLPQAVIDPARAMQCSPNGAFVPEQG